MINDEDANLLNRLSDLMNKKYSAECSEAASNAHDRLHALLEQNHNLKNEHTMLQQGYVETLARFNDTVLDNIRTRNTKDVEMLESIKNIINEINYY